MARRRCQEVNTTRGNIRTAEGHRTSIGLLERRGPGHVAEAAGVDRVRPATPAGLTSRPATTITRKSSEPREPPIQEHTPMQAFASRIKRFLQSEDGPTAVEYAVMLALILVACVTIVTSLGSSVSGTFSQVNS